MLAIKNIFLKHLRKQLRDRYSIFWNLVFPLVLLTILALIFGGQTGEDISFDISIARPESVRDTSEENQSYAMIIDDVIRSIEESEDSRWFQFHHQDPEQSAEEFIAQEEEFLESGDRHLILKIPEGSLPEPDQIEIYRQPGSQLSNIAADVINSIVTEINREINIAEGNVSREQLIATTSRQIDVSLSNGEEDSFSMAEYLVPGIILFTFLSSGVEVLVGRISSMRARGILRRYFATPLKPIQYFAGILAFIIVLSIVQVLLIHGWSIFFFDINLDLFNFDFIFYMVFALIVSVSMGFMVLSLVKSKESVGVVTQALTYPMAFLSGIFFEVTGMTGILGLIVAINPMTYLVNGMRDILGVYPSPTSDLLNLIVPAIWMIGSIAISLVKFSWNPGGDS